MLERSNSGDSQNDATPATKACVLRRHGVHAHGAGARPATLPLGCVWFAYS